MMQDNGLIDVYRQYANKRGLLMLPKSVFDEEKDYQRVVKSPIGRSGEFYVKQCPAGKVAAEVLLSQIYANAGFETAIYTPAKIATINKYVNNAVALSNDVSYDRVPAREAYLGIFGSAMNFYNYFVNADVDEIDFDDFFTKAGLQEFVKMHIFDFACFNIDRHFNNYFVKTKDGKIDGLTLIDYGQAFNIMPYANAWDLDFKCGLGNGYLKSDNEMFAELNTNPIVASFYTCSEIGEMIGGINVEETARDIKGEIGYEMQQDYVDMVSRRIDDLADRFVQN